MHGVSAHWRSVAEPQAGARLQALQLTFQSSVMVLRLPTVSVLDRFLASSLAVRSPLFSLLELNISSKPKVVDLRTSCGFVMLCGATAK